MTQQKKLELSLLLLRITVFLVMLMWTIDKFINVDHAVAVYQHFYFISSNIASKFMFIFALIELAIIIGFLSGWQKKYTYGLVLLFHSVSTLSSWKHYLSPYEEINLLFFAAWPMLAACFALFLLRDQDTLYTIKK